MSGNILAAAAQPAAYSPFTLIACLLPAAQSFTFTAAITFFIAALAMFLFARELGCRESAALFGGAAFTYSAGMAFFNLWPIAASWALLPFVLFAVRRANAALLTVAFTLLILAGHPESVLQVVFVGAAYGVFELVRRKNFHSIGAALIAGIASLAICAIYLLPLLDAAPQTLEYEYRHTVYRATPHIAQPMRLASDILGRAGAPPDSAAV